MDADRVKAMEERPEGGVLDTIDALMFCYGHADGDSYRAMVGRGLVKAAADMLREMWEEITRLKARLEVSPEHDYDGIACRDETIRLQDERIEGLRNKCALLSAALAQAEKRGEKLEDTIRRLSAPDTV